MRQQSLVEMCYLPSRKMSDVSLRGHDESAAFRLVTGSNSCTSLEFCSRFAEQSNHWLDDERNIASQTVDAGTNSILPPPLPLQREFARRVSAVETLKTAQRASLAELDALFATLQHRAFSGEAMNEDEVIEALCMT